MIGLENVAELGSRDVGGHIDQIGQFFGRVPGEGAAVLTPTHHGRRELRSHPMRHERQRVPSSFYRHVSGLRRQHFLVQQRSWHLVGRHYLY
jgi:hypothetical protein